MSAQIQVILGPDRGQTFLLPATGALTVGRSHATDTKLTDASVSRVHCRIEFDGHRAVLVNVSAKGTQVNATPVTEQELRHGDVIRVGGTEIRFALTALAEAETLLQHGSESPSAIDAPRPEEGTAPEPIRDR
jgi:pSer/pThr/pTyr-binding forkhead associated (FHA) protein